METVFLLAGLYSISRLYVWLAEFSVLSWNLEELTLPGEVVTYAIIIEMARKNIIKM